MNNIKLAILQCITNKPLLASEVRSLLLSKFTERDLRREIMNLWCDGIINVGLDQKLVSNSVGTYD